MLNSIQSLFVEWHCLQKYKPEPKFVFLRIILLLSKNEEPPVSLKKNRFVLH